MNVQPNPESCGCGSKETQVKTSVTKPIVKK